MPWDATQRAVCSEWIGLHWNPIQCNPMANLSGGILRQADVPLTGRHLEFLEAELELLVGFVVAERRDDLDGQQRENESVGVACSNRLRH